MTTRTLPLALATAAALTLAGCGSGAAVTTAAPAAAPAARAGEYVDYHAWSSNLAAHQNTDTVLFFHAPWCPDCRATEASIDQDGVPAGLTVVKVDYDSMTDLKQKYGITQQHTFVKIDGHGNLVAKWTTSFTGADIKAKADAA